MALLDPTLRSLYDLKVCLLPPSWTCLILGQVFVQCDSDLMLARRIRRDIVERGRDVAGILDQYAS